MSEKRKELEKKLQKIDEKYKRDKYSSLERQMEHDQRRHIRAVSGGCFFVSLNFFIVISLIMLLMYI